MSRTDAVSSGPAAGRDLALCRSVLYEALALGFRPPTAGTCRRLTTGEAAASLADAAAMIDPGLDPAARDLAAAGPPAAPEVLAARHQLIFGHTARGLASAYETEYGQDTLFQKPQELSDIGGFLRAFGLAPAPGARDRIDHISSELEFLAFLCRKEAHAIEIGDETMRERTRSAAGAFLRDHLGRFVPAFARRVMGHDARGFYGRLAALCLAFVRSECSRHGVPAGDETLHLRVPLDDLAPMACGVPGGCVPGPCGPSGGQ